MAERISGHTELIGLIATPIRHSASPKMHNEAFAKLGLDYAYLAFEVGIEQLSDTIKGFKALKIKGANVSMPNKQAIIPYLDEISEAAKLCNAVNTIVLKDNKYIGHITDGIGFMESLKDKNWNVINQKMTLVGAGGAATAIMVQGALDGIKEIVVYNKKDQFFDSFKEKLKEFESKTKCKLTLKDLDDLTSLKKDMHDSYLFVNATGVGMKPMEGISYIPDASYFLPSLKVVDIIYSPKETKLLQLAKEAGCDYINGERMVLFQGAASFKIWMEQEMPIDYMKDILNIR